MAFENLVIHWRDQALKWLLLDDAQLPLREGQGTLEDLAEVLSEYELPLHTSVLLSGESVLLKTIEVPPKPTRQILDAVPYLVEEYLACDVADCFIAIGERRGNDLTVGVIDERFLADCLGGLKTIGLDPEFLGIDLDVIACDQCLLVVDDDVALLSQGDAEMVAFETAQILTRLELLYHGDLLALNIVDFTEGQSLEALLPSAFVDQSQRLPAPARSLLQYLHQQPKTKRLNFRQGQFAQASQGASGKTWLWQLGKVALFVMVLQLLFAGAQGLYLFNQANDMAAEARTLYEGLYPNDKNPRDLGRRWRSRLNAGGQQDQLGLTKVLDTVSPALVAARLQLDNLNFNAGRGDLMLQLSGERSEQIMGLAEVLNVAGFQSEIGTISQEKSSVRGSLRVRMGDRP